MRGLSLRRLGRLVPHAFVAALAASASLAGAREPVWLRVQAPRFGVVSQLDEDATRQWAVEFDQFIEGLHRLFSTGEADLPPLTIVLFDQPRDFRRYRMRTESGKKANVDGFFANAGTWSVIGLAGHSGSDETRRIIYHEAVHWFSSGDDVEQPLWFEEGLAEVFSSFEVDAGKARWGMPWDDDVEYLNSAGLQPMDDFLRLSQDESLHSDSYYPQAWAFVHYLIFGENGARRTQLTTFLREQRETDLDTAFASAFGESPSEMTNDLRRYLQSGYYGIAELEVPDRSNEMTIGPATPVQVQASLARLAVAAGNDDVARPHIDAVIAAAPNASAGYELLAVVAEDVGDDDAETKALDKAIELGSRDANVYLMKATLLLEQQQGDDVPLDELIAGDTARAAANLLARSIALAPRDRDAYESLALALLNTDEITEQDAATLAVGRRVLPTDGFVLVGEAAVEKARGNVAEAARLLRRARSEPFTLRDDLRDDITSLHDAWLINWAAELIGALANDEQFAAAHAFLDQQLADATITGRPRTAFAGMQSELHEFERLHAADTAARAGDVAGARALLTEIANDPSASERLRRTARDLLDRTRPDR